MKTLIQKFFLALAFFSIASSVYSSNTEKLTISFNSPGIVQLRYVGTSGSFPKVLIVNAKKETVYSEVVSNKYGIAKIYNLTTLPEGVYTFKVLDNGEIVEKTIHYSKEKSIDSEKLLVYVTPAKEQGKFQVTCVGVKNKNVVVKILDQKQQVLIQDNVDVKEDFSRKYDLSKSYENEFTFVVTVEGKEVIKEVRL